MKLSTDMVGRSITEFYPDRGNKPGEVIWRSRTLISQVCSVISTSIYAKGEILGVAGLMGSGRTEIMRAVFGVDKCQSGGAFKRSAFSN